MFLSSVHQNIQCNCPVYLTLINVLPSDIMPDPEKDALVPSLQPGIYLSKGPIKDHNHDPPGDSFGGYQHMRVGPTGQLIGPCLYQSPQDVPPSKLDLFWKVAANFSKFHFSSDKVKRLLEEDDNNSEFRHIIYIKRLTAKLIYNKCR